MESSAKIVIAAVITLIILFLANLIAMFMVLSAFSDLNTNHYREFRTIVGTFIIGEQGKNPTNVVVTTPEPAPLQTPKSEATALYLESDIFAKINTDILAHWSGHPENGSFIMDEKTYYRGMTIYYGYPSNKLSASTTYNLDGLGITKLTGLLGFVEYEDYGIERSSSCSLVVTCDDSGKFIGGVDLKKDDKPKIVDIIIPNDVTQIKISFFVDESKVGFGDVFLNDYRFLDNLRNG